MRDGSDNADHELANYPVIIGNVKKSINGSYHAINSDHLPRYLAEFCYRFNRRFKLRQILPRFMYMAL